MPLPTPILDDRHFQDIVDEAKKRIPHYCKEWSDHNVSDPGVTLIELFAWMTDLMIYRLNQVPDLHYVKFLELLGIKLKGPEPAKVPVTFWLSAPQETAVIIPAVTEVSTTQTESQKSIIFSTDTDFHIHPPQWRQVLSRKTSSDGQKGYAKHNMRRLEAGFEGVEIFSSVPQENDALYFGFENELSYHILGFDFDFDKAGGAGIDPSLPPIVWEASTGMKDTRWEPCEIALDETKGMNVPGRIQIYLPQMGKYAVNRQKMFWVRARIKEISDVEIDLGMRSYQKSPRMQRVSVSSWGGTIPCTHAQIVTQEHLGQSDGTPGQTFSLKNTPILQRKPDETVLVKIDSNNPQKWSEVHDFADSDAHDLHYTLDSTTGELRFGPSVRLRDGTIKLYGAIPPRKAVLIFERYRHGGGEVGNVQPHMINTLKTSIPFIARVINPRPAVGGLDAETLDAAKMRAPAMLRTRERAVTEADFEFLAHQAAPAEIDRVKCLQPKPAAGGDVIPGQVYILIIPRVPYPDAYIEPEDLKLKDELVNKLSTYLDERRLLTTHLIYQKPAYQWLSVHIKLRAAPDFNQNEVEQNVLAHLYHFLNPIKGGPDHNGWPFGRNVFISDVYQSLQGLPGIQFIRSLEIYRTDESGKVRGNTTEEVEIVAHGTAASSIHQVEFV